MMTLSEEEQKDKHRVDFRSILVPFSHSCIVCVSDVSLAFFNTLRSFQLFLSKKVYCIVSYVHKRDQITLLFVLEVSMKYCCMKLLTTLVLVFQGENFFLLGSCDGCAHASSLCYC